VAGPSSVSESVDGPRWPLDRIPSRDGADHPGRTGAWPAPGGAANGFLVRPGGCHLVLDFGLAVLPNP
jgi:hypothetical protein